MKAGNAKTAESSLWQSGKQRMDKVIALLTLVLSGTASAANVQPYTFNYSNKMAITVSATNKQTAYAAAARLCFQRLTGGTYQGEERSMDIIDTCINPLNYRP